MMDIFIDESGAFVPLDGFKSHVSATAALTIPTAVSARLQTDFLALRDSWGRGPEVKGSSLSERDIASVIELLTGYDVLFDAVVIDAGRHSARNLSDFQSAQAEGITAHLTERHHPELVRELHELRAAWQRLPHQLVLQAYAMMALVVRVLRYAPLYYVQRSPVELGDFNWVIDGKDIDRTAFETVWTSLLKPFAQDQFLRRPAMHIRGCDYSHFKKFELRFERVPDHLRDSVDVPPEEGITGSDLRLILNRSWRFGDSSIEPGLQLVDILASAITRAMNGNLRPEGWRGLSRLIVGKERGDQCVSAILLSADPSVRDTTIVRTSFHGHVLEQLDADAKSMFP